MALINELFLRSFTPIKMLKQIAASTNTRQYMSTDNMRAWTVPSFGTLDRLRLLNTVPSPVITNHKDVIVKVQAASINPIDVAMVGGYGNTLLNVMRQCNSFISTNEESNSNPLIPGRDFVGEIIAKGSGVRPDLKIGDQIYGVVEAHSQGCHADIVAARESMVRHIPGGVKPVELAGFLYCALTAWSALCITGDLFWSTREGKKALVIGAAGGVGSLAVQMLKAWNIKVAGTCRKDAIHLLDELGVDVAIDYTAPNAMKMLEDAGKYDIILDAAGNVTHYTYVPFLKDWANSKYITLRSPLLANTDKYGFVVGMMKNASDLMKCNIISGAPTRGATIRWAYFLPIEAGVDELHSLLSQKKIRPIVSDIFSFNELPKAYERVRAGHNRGKVVVILAEAPEHAKAFAPK